MTVAKKSKVGLEKTVKKLIHSAYQKAKKLIESNASKKIPRDIKERYSKNKKKIKLKKWEDKLKLLK